MPPSNDRAPQGSPHVGPAVVPPATDMLRVGSRRWFLQTGLAGLAGLTLADTLRLQAASTTRSRDPRAVILFWLSGGPSQLDTWDPKPDAPAEIRGPYRTIPTSVPGIRLSEHLPLQARLMHKLSILRTVDCSASTHTPITMQAASALALHTNEGNGYPSMGSIAARFRGPNHPSMPAFIGLADSWKADVYGAGHLGAAYQPVKGNELAGRLALPPGIAVPRLRERDEMRRQFDQLQRRLDVGSGMEQTDRYTSLALDMVVSPTVRQAFDLDRESDRMREAYGRCSVGEKALLARRLVEAGSTFVLVSGRWGYFDHHGDNVPPWGGIQKGLTPILPTIDRALTTLIEDLDARGLLDSTLILMMGEFGRSPVMTKDAGRDHWLPVMSMLLAGGGGRHGQAIGSTDERGGTIKSRPIQPGDLAATVFRHLGIPLDAQWTNPQGRPIPIVTGEGRPLSELS
ncbi:MAG: DUF1501 domain-containing protein [Gemmataceae bacterium]